MVINWAATAVKWAWWAAGGFVALTPALGMDSGPWLAVAGLAVATAAVCVFAMYQSPWPWRLEISRPWEDGE